MGERIIKTGLSKKYKDMLDAVIGQMSDGYWENTPMMRGYWEFVTTGTSGDEVTLNVDETSVARDGDRRIENRFYGMPDDGVKKFFADKIKFLIKEEGVGKWDRSNDSKTDYLSYGEPHYRVKDCYYAYEVLKGRNARKHPEYDDVAEAIRGTKSEGRLHLGRCKNCGRGWIKTYYLDELNPDVRKYFKGKGYPDNADICPKCVAAAKDYLAQNKAAGADEAFEGWDGWEDIEGLEGALESIENLTYELRSCVRGAKTRCKDWAELGAYIAKLGSDLAEAGENATYKSESKKKNPSKNFSSTVEEDEDGKKKSH